MWLLFGGETFVLNNQSINQNDVTGLVTSPQFKVSFLWAAYGNASGFTSSWYLYLSRALIFLLFGQSDCNFVLS